MIKGLSETEMLSLGCFLANCLWVFFLFFSNIKASADSWLRNTERTTRCKWISCLSEVILEYFQMDGVIIIGTFVALINPFYSAKQWSQGIRNGRTVHQDIVITTMFNRAVDDLVRDALFIERIAVSTHLLCHPRLSNSDSWHISGPRAALRPLSLPRQRQKAFLANFITMQELPT